MLTKILCLLIRLYQITLATVLPRSCRFHPSCSEYARQALQRHGPGYGGLLALKRLLRCNPFFPGGYDPVPEKTPSRRRNR